MKILRRSFAAERVIRIPKKSKKTKIENSGDLSFGSEKNFSLSIGEALGGKLPSGHVSAAKNEKPELSAQQNVKSESPREADKESIQKAILHRESAGRGGRTVTVVDVRPPLDADAALNLAKSMRKGLGCGSHIEGSRIILQGDIGDRAEAWFIKRGVKKIIRGN